MQLAERAEAAEQVALVLVHVLHGDGVHRLRVRAWNECLAAKLWLVFAHALGLYHVIRPRRSVREIADLVQQARDDLRRAHRSLDDILDENPNLPALQMRLQSLRALLGDVLYKLRQAER